MAQRWVSLLILAFVASAFVYISGSGEEVSQPALPNLEKFKPDGTNLTFTGGPLLIVLPQEVKAPQVSTEIYFCKERMPLEFTDIYERFDQELLRNTYWHSSTLLNMKRLGKYFEAIDTMFKKHGIPKDMRFLAIAESNLSNVVSPAGAAGYWQFMKATGQSYGLEVTSTVDERYHFEKSTEAACLFLKDMYRQIIKDYPNTKTPWTLAAAAYNMGYPALRKKMNQQKVDNYYDLHLNQETARYVFRITAFKVILENPQDFGYSLNEEDLYKMEDTQLIYIDSSISSLADFAISQNTTYKELKRLNPWLRGTALNVIPSKTYEIALPVVPQVHQVK